jgi:hypothetical protein
MIVTALKPSTKKVYEAARFSFEKLMKKRADFATAQDVETWLHILSAAGDAPSTCRTFLSAINHISGLKISPSGLPRRTPKTNATLTNEQVKKVLKSMNKEDTALFILLLIFGIEARNWSWGKVMNEQLNIPRGLWLAIADHAIDKGYSSFPLTYYGPAYHWINGAPLLDAAFTSGKRRDLSAAPLTIQEVGRRLKKYGLWAGIRQDEISLRLWVRTGDRLLLEHRGNIEEVSEAFCPKHNLTPILTAGPAMKNSRQVVSSAIDTRKSTTALVDRDPRLHGIGRRKRVAAGD